MDPSVVPGTNSPVTSPDKPPILGSGKVFRVPQAIKSYDALVQSVRPKLVESDRAAVDLTLECIRRQLPKDALCGVAASSASAPSAETARDPAYFGPASDIRYFNIVRNHMLVQETPHTTDGEDPQSYDQSDSPNPLSSMAQPLQLPAKATALTYLDIYFSTIHVAYPFLSRSMLLHQLDKLWGGEIGQVSGRHPWLALLSMCPLLSVRLN